MATVETRSEPCDETEISPDGHRFGLVGPTDQLGCAGAENSAQLLSKDTVVT